MYISYKWLQKYLPNLHQYKHEEIAEALTNTLAEVEEFKAVRSELSNIIVGEVKNVEKHPDSDKLSVCKVDIGTSKAQTIICGAPNVTEGQKVAVCLPGGTVYDPKEANKTISIEEREVRGVVSQGMICSAKELGISDEHEDIMVLEPDLETGINIAEMISDIIYEIENKSISHRGDCFSHRGIARELSAILNVDYLTPKFDEISLITNPEINFDIEVKVEEDLCPRFSAIVIKDAEIKDSPLWLQSLLSAVGVRPINNIVDIINYVMMDKGQPMHAYDYDKLKMKKLVVRKAKEGETVKTLDSQEYKLTPEMVVITDGSQVEDIAGIMGGFDSQITKDTKTIVFESANWNMFNIRKTSRMLHIRTEASTRYEKGQDPNLTEEAIKSAAKLVIDTTNSEVASDLIDYYPDPKGTKEVTLDLALVNRFLGIEISRQDIITLLEGLNLTLLEKDDDDNTNQVNKTQLTFIIPSYRLDINAQQDLLEEIARLYGYDQIIPTLPERDLKATKNNPISILERKVTYSLTSTTGLDEVMTYSFVGKDIYEKTNLDIKKCLEIENPISPELSHMRNTLVPSLVEKIFENSKNINDFGIFEIGKRIEMELDENGIHKQPRLITGAVYNDVNKNDLFFDAKGIVDNLTDSLNIEVSYDKKLEKSIILNAFHPGRSATIRLGENILGYIGEVHPKVLFDWDIEGRLAIFELDFDLILKNYSKDPHYQQTSSFQTVTRDLSFWFKNDTEYSQIEAAISSLDNNLIKEISLKDLFQPEDNDKKSITISITLQSDEKTLSDKEISITIDKITNTIEKGLKATLRSGK